MLEGRDVNIDGYSPVFVTRRAVLGTSRASDSDVVREPLSNLDLNCFPSDRLLNFPSSGFFINRNSHHKNNKATSRYYQLISATMSTTLLRSSTAARSALRAGAGKRAASMASTSFVRGKATLPDLPCMLCTHCCYNSL